IETRLAGTTRERFKAAEVSELDVNTVQLDLQRLTQERALLKNERELMLVALNTLLGRTASSPLTLSEPFPKLGTLPELSSLQTQAFDRRPDLFAATLSVDRAQAERTLAHASRWEDWSVELELGQDKQVIEGLPPQDSSRSIGVNVSIPLPLFNKSQGQIAEANANEDQARARIEALRFGIASELASAHAEATRLQSTLIQYDQHMLPVSRRNVKLAQQGYRQGLVPIFDVVQAQRQQAELNANYLEIFGQYLQALVRLHTAAADYLPTSSEHHSGIKE
ncbi:MAG: TolC family protein, partial [Arenimonas sp.]